ncbi:helix-turn-helix domain-containing protein [[Kitasatospora] papulosa]|uniref:helix-turn-helix domain-containing protein n=1 Tax=[Kitasatospora] papulosa TaxID=1464011 RepID=UPI0036C035E6
MITDETAHIHGRRKYAKRLAGDERTAKARVLADSYTAGASLRALAEVHAMSYGTVRQLLLDAKVQLRPRGGARPPK